jgi:hypothetical protein
MRHQEVSGQQVVGDKPGDNFIGSVGVDRGYRPIGRFLRLVRS